MRRGATGLCGVLAIDKPAGITSHDVVDRVRRITGERRVGHAGTLDPMATGLMLVGVGAATRLSQYLTGHDKTYEARIVFGACTDTDDALGSIIASEQLSGPGQNLSVLEGIDSHDEVQRLVGSSQQLPPAYSAIKKDGVTAYRAAREGKQLELEPRAITVHAATLRDTGTLEAVLDDGRGGQFEGALPYWDVELSVSKGTYIRSIARDLGLKLGCGAYLGALRRTAIAGFPVERACTLEQLQEAVHAGDELPWCDPAELLGFPVRVLDEAQAAAVSCGKAFAGEAGAPFVSCVAGGKLVAVYRPEDGQLRPATVIPGGVSGAR